ncbi:MAG: hypothetical protein OEU26_00035 [Candidatus Tectomicrobia bacterium]|nr:hypothetical protein [Candidatus Tectomicrobia bacterium]
MYRKPMIALLIVAIFGATTASAQTLYNESLNANRFGNLSINDSGSSFRGGVNFRPFNDPTRSATLFRGGVQNGGLCNFDLIAGFVEQFAELPDLILALLGPLAAGFALQIICESAPSYCDIVKQIYQAANVSLRASFQRCDQLVLTGMSLATASQRDALKRCVEAKQAAGITVELAMRQCPAEINAPGGINGVEAADLGIVRTLLETAGVPPELVGQITGLVGEIRLTADGPAFGQEGTKQRDSIFATYEELIIATTEAVTTAVEDLEGGIIPSAGVLAQLGGPGFPASADALLEIAREPDEDVKNYEIQRYAANIAFNKMTWDIHELSSTLQDTTESSALTPEIRDRLEAKEKSLRRQVARIRDMREANTYLEGQVAELLNRKARREHEIASIAARGASAGIASRYPAGQTPMGYTR